MTYEELFFRVHAIERMLEQDITEVEVRDVIENGHLIEQETDQFGARKSLHLHVVAERPLHVLPVDDDEARRTEVITVYEPDFNRWKPGFRTRRRHFRSVEQGPDLACSADRSIVVECNTDNTE